MKLIILGSSATLVMNPIIFRVFVEIGKWMLDDYNSYQIDVSVFNNFIFKRGVCFIIFEIIFKV